MAVEKFIEVTASKDNGYPLNPTKKRGIPIDGIRFVYDHTTHRQILWERSEVAPIEPTEVTETLQGIIDAANASGYTQNGLVIATVKQMDGITFTPSKSIILNRNYAVGKVLNYTDATLGVTNGTKILYKRYQDKQEIPIIIEEAWLTSPSPAY